ncbi:L-threonylcarbamoyladenylate synthase [Staphylococcus felis]|uniref:L-threonylcarbamoyladenylate synthase n=1 Tax=Staphylococcus felis TaxID=46127 RepID=UPI0024807294|nr:L-threonylcarbamoyladenylate synthase [Staphylococcus felis]MDQ7191977.1 L-threonylcarbamoyladenylate synthase [Staphylococcus felis]
MKSTKIWDVRDYHTHFESYPKLDEIISTYEKGGLVVLPTETVYGLGANACDDQAVQNIYKAKGRPSDNPLIVHIYETEQLDAFVAEMTESTIKLMEAFWPGPITFILPLKKGYLCDSVTGGLDTIAVRMPSHPVARTLLKVLNKPIAAPSANLSGRPSPTTFDHVYQDLNGRVDGIIQSSQSEAGLESTVLDCTSYPFKVARPGTITRTMLNEILPNSIDENEITFTDKPIAPGMKYKHYAPDTPLKMIQQINGPIYLGAHEDWSNVAFIIPKSLEHLLPKESPTIILSETTDDITTANHNLYDALHRLDQLPSINMAYIYGYLESNEAEALVNRMIKATNHQFVKDELL